MGSVTLVIMAAGIGSRFGERIKQLEPIGPNGELLIDYSIYDAIQAGISKVVFIIRKDIEELFRKAIGDRIAKQIAVEYAFQEKTDIPVRQELAEKRSKPWGTGQAILSARKLVNEPFVVINADDFYGRESFEIMCEHLKNADNSGKTVLDYCMAGFMLKNTLSDNGTVTRGVVKPDDNGNLHSITETYEVARRADGRIFSGRTGAELSDNDVVSMNMWGFTPELFATLEKKFTDYLNAVTDETINKEFLIPVVVDELIKSKSANVKMLRTDSKWFGVTYAEDKELVVKSIADCIKSGYYPEKLWG